jgi:hypothetical protein
MGTSCGKEWSRQFLNASFPKTFLQGEWRKSREKIAFDRETALLPATQEIIVRNNIIAEARQKLNVIFKEIDLNTTHYMTEYKKQKKVFNPDGDEVPEHYKKLRARRDELITFIRENYTKKGPERKNKFVRVCPSEECRGFLSSDWKCGLCNLETCNKCHVIKTEKKHTCNPDDVETAKLLANDTKPCPKCHTGIFKIDGCDQMWCTQCHTAFSWKTGNIESKIHNPHFYEWQRSMNGGVAPRVEGDVPCQHELQLNHGLYRNILNHSDMFMAGIMPKIGNLIQNTIHLREVELPDFQPQITDAEDAQTLRIRYLEKKIDKPLFIRNVLKVAKRNEINAEIRQILEMYIQVITDIVFRFYRDIRNKNYEKLTNVVTSEIANRMIQEIETLSVYVNDRLRELYTTFKYKVRQIQSMFEPKKESYYAKLFNIDNAKLLNTVSI